MKTGIELIADERQEQIEKHGRTVATDVEQNEDGQLRDAAYFLISISPTFWAAPLGWDTAIWQKMCEKEYADRLIIAGALIAAELDRLNGLNKK